MRILVGMKDLQIARPELSLAPWLALTLLFSGACGPERSSAQADEGGSGGRGGAAGSRAGAGGEPTAGVGGSPPRDAATSGPLDTAAAGSAGAVPGPDAAPADAARGDAGATRDPDGATALDARLPALPPVTAAEQLATVKKLAARVCRTVVTFDAQNNVVALNVSNHSVFCKGAVPAGLTDEDARDLLKFPELRRVRFEGMPLTPAGYQVLARFTQLEAALFAYPTASPDFMLSVKDQLGLKLLELKHLFSVTGSRLDQMPTYPALRMLELDVISANRTYALPFIKRHPHLLSLQLHRTNLTNDDIGEIVAAVPDLEGLELKPSGPGMNEGVFVHVGKLRKLRVLQLTGLSVPAWEAGGKALAGLTQLRVIIGGVAADSAVQLRAINPGMGIGGVLDAEQRALTDKDNPYFLNVVTPWFTTGRKQEYRFDQLQATVGSEDIG